MKILRSKIVPGGSDYVPYGDTCVAIDYMTGAMGEIEIEATPEYMRSEEWMDRAMELIFEEHGDEIDSEQIFDCCDFHWDDSHCFPGIIQKFIIHYSV